MRRIIKLSLLILGLLMPVSAAALSLSMPNIEAAAGSVVTIPVNLQNDVAVKGLQFNFYYPTGFEVQSITGTDRVAEGSNVASMDHESFYTVAVFNTSTNISVEEAGYGAVVNIRILVPDNAAGTYSMSLGNMMLSMADGTHTLSDVSATITVPTTQNVLCTSIALDHTSAVINAGENLQLTATVLPENAGNKTVTWTSSDRSVATVSSNGLVTALTTGTATITATTNDGTNLSAVCNVTVIAETSQGNVYLEIQNATASAGSVVNIPVYLQNDIAVRGFQFNFYYPEGFEVQGITRTDRVVEGASVASNDHDGFYTVLAYNTSTNISVSETGYGQVLNISVVVPANAAGTYNMSLGNIMISMADGSSYALSDVIATITISSPETVLCSSIALDQTSANLNAGETLQLTATVLPDNAANKTITWTCSDRSVASVSSNGLVTALTAGTATITATTCDGSNLSATCNVTVTAQASQGNVYIDMPNVQCAAGSVVSIPIYLQNDITAKGFQLDYYYPEGFEVQGVEKTDRLTEGTRAASTNNNGFYRVYVYNTTTNISVMETGYGQVLTLTVKVPDNAAGTYDMSLRNMKVSMSDGSNVVVSDFTATITIPSPGTVLCSSIALDNTSAMMNAGETLQLTATVLPENAANKAVTWTTSNRNVATVSDDGLVTALTAGTATITATTCDGTNLSAVCNVTVTAETSHGDVYLEIQNAEATAETVVNIPVYLQNDIAVRGFQFNYYYPEGFEVQGITKTDRVIEGATVASMGHEGYYTVVAYNTSTNISVSETGYGQVLNLSVMVPANAAGTYNMSLSNIMISMADGSSYALSDVVATINVSSAQSVLCSSIALDHTSAVMNAGENLQLTATVLPDNAANKTLTWTSSDRSVATVSSNGLVTALTSGTAIITATTNDGSNLSATCNVTIVAESSSNHFDIADATAFHGQTIVIPVALVNDESILAFQTDVFLPEGFTIATDEDDEYMITPSDRLTSNHVIMTEPVSNGSVRIVCYTPAALPIGGNSGDDLFYITVNVPADASGEYTISLQNSRLTTAEFTEMRIPVEEAVLSIGSYVPGDANGSGSVTVTDIVVTAQYILELNPESFDFDAADLNGDGEITVTDIMIIARIILNPNTLNFPMRAPMLSANNDFMSGESITLMPGETRTVSIALDNDIDYSAFQLDLNLPDGLTASNFSLTDRAGSHALDVNTLSNGKTRALCYSPAIAAISGHEGALLTFDVTATGNVRGDITVDGIEMVTTAFQTVKLGAFGIGVNSQTAINEAATGKTIASVDYFNVAGQRLSEPTSGITIVVTHYTDGTHSTVKVMR